MAMTKDQIMRYSRHLILPEVGVEGQEKLLAAKVLLVGAGGLGAPIALYLAASGVGTIGVVEFDTVDVSNLQRQILYTVDDIGVEKGKVAVKKLTAMNPDLHVVHHAERLTSENAMALFADYDYIVDGTDNFPTRYLINDACVLSGKVNVYGSIYRFDGQATIYGHPDGPCYRCIFPVPPGPGEVPSCSEGGVVGVLPGLVGLVQATEVIKLITGIGESLVGRLLLLDALNMRWREMKIKKDPACPVCGTHRSVHKLVDYEQFCGLNGNEENVEEISASEVRKRINDGKNPIFLDVRNIDKKTHRINDAVIIPLNEIIDRLADMEAHKDRDIVVYCQDGISSVMAVRIMQSRGFKNSMSLVGGYTGWLKSE